MESTKPILNINYNPQTSSSREHEDYNSWWTLTDYDLSKALWFAVDSIQTLESRRRINARNAIMYEDCYEDRSLSGYPHNFGKVPTFQSRVGYNVTKSVIDTVVSKITKNKPKVQFLTDNGTHKERNRAKNLTKYVNSSFRDFNIYEKNALTLRGSCVYGTGATKFYKDVARKRVGVEHCLIDEIIVDDLDGIYGKPKCLYQARYVSKTYLIGVYPKFKEEILSAIPIELTNSTKSDLVPIVEAWRLPVEDNPGKHAIAIKGACLFEEDYAYHWFPFVFAKWTNPLQGFYGTGIADQLVNIQKEIDRTLRNISQSLHLVGTPKIFLPTSSGISSEEITNMIAQIIKYTPSGAGDKPIFFTPTAMNAEAYNHLKWLIESAYQLIGVSELSAQSQKPPGLNASVALRTVQDIETQRFFTIADNYQNMFLDSANIIVSMSRELDKDLKAKGEKKGLWVKGISDKEMESIKWSDCDMDEDRYVMEAWPVNMLPDRPEGKVQTITDLIKSQILKPDKAHKLLKYPDVQSEIEKEYAAENLIDKILSNILEEGVYTSPEPYFDLNYALKSAQEYYNLGKLEKAPEPHLMKILYFMDDVERLLAFSAEQAPQQPENVDPEMQINPDELGDPLAGTLPTQIENQGLTQPIQQ